MNINDYFTFKPDNEKSALIKRMHNFLNNQNDVFILSGYAGTGKTTFLKALAIYLSKTKREFHLFASTGRAATILANKTNYPTSTIHMGIYTFDEELIADNYRTLLFKLAFNNASDNAVYIIDESSMISNRKSKNTFINFGTGALLTDIVKYTQGRKVIFVGDSAQLPPVNSDISPALTESYLKHNFNLQLESFKLKHIHRQKTNSGILKISLHFINRFNKNDFNRIRIHASRSNDVIIHHRENDFLKSYSETYDFTTDLKNVLICVSNKSAHHFNMQIRNLLFKQADILEKNEQFVVYANNYLYDVFNGQGIVLKEYSKTTERKAGLNFRKCKFGFINKKRRDFEAFIIDEYLLSPKPGISAEAERNLMIDFSYRMKKLNVFPRNKMAWVENLKNDPYLNALRIRYSYAMTCHKAQGGEWDNVYLFFENYFGSFDLKYQHRWTYTAVARSRNKLHLLSNPYIF